MKVHLGGRAFLVAAVVAAAAVLAVGFFAVLGVRSGVAGPDAAPAAAPPNPGHSYSQIELPAGTWPGLDADLLDGLHASEIMGSPGFSTTTVDGATTNVGRYTSVTVGADGLPIISYWDQTNNDLKVAHCSQADCSDTVNNIITTVDGTGNVGIYSAVTVGADGLALISYYDSTNSDLKVAHCGAGACGAGNTITTVDSTGDVGQSTSVTVGADGWPVISYWDRTNGDLKVAHCGNAACSAGNVITTVDGATTGIGEYVSVTVGADGLALISYYDDTNDDLKVLHCSQADCSDTVNNIITTVDSTGLVGQQSSVAVGADGLALISYWDQTNGNLKVLDCSQAACSDTLNNIITTVDSTGVVGGYSSVTVGADGLPIISYWDQTNNDLKVAHCSNADCSASTTTTVDGGGTSVGGYTSVTVGADGLPVISYYDWTNQDLKVAHCSNRLCVPYHRPR